MLFRIIHISMNYELFELFINLLICQLDYRVSYAVFYTVCPIIIGSDFKFASIFSWGYFDDILVVYCMS